MNDLKKTIVSNNKRCFKCLLPSNFPNISFNENGICNYCLKNDKFSDLGILKQKNLELIGRKVSDAKKNGGKYEAILCYSGGKDSTYTLIKVIKKYGLKTLAFTFDNGYISERAFKNIKNIVENVKVDHITFKPSKADFDEIIKIVAQKNIFPKNIKSRISDLCYACITMVNTYAYNLAIANNAPLIFSGFTLGQIPLNSVVYSYSPEMLSEFREMTFSKLLELCSHNQQRFFEFISKEGQFNPTFINPLAIENLTEKEIISSIEKYGWELPKDVDSCSTNCRLNQIGNFIHKKRYKFSPYASEIACALRAGLIDKKTAIEKLDDTGDMNLIEEVAKKLDIDLNQIEESS